MPKVVAGNVAEHRQTMLDRVFAAFEALMYDRGYDALTLADIAKEAGMARTAMYNYFPDKESLLLAYTEREMDDFFSRLRAELFRHDDPSDRLRAYVRAQLTYFSTHHLPPGPGLRLVLTGTGYRGIRRHAETLEVLLQGILEDAAAEGQISPSVLEDGQTVTLINASLTAGHIRDLRGAELDAAIASTEDFVLRAVGFDAAPH